MISAFSAALSVWLIFLLFSQLFGYAAGIGAQLLALVGTQFPSFAVTATTDVFFLMLCLAAMTVFLSPALTARWRLALTAALTGFAYLTRYNGLFLLVTVAVGILVVTLHLLFRRFG